MIRWLLFTAAVATTASLPIGLITSAFQLQYTPSIRLGPAEIAVLEDATLSILKDALSDDYFVNQTQVIFELQAASDETVTFRASTVSATANQEDWQAFVENALRADLIFNAVSSELEFLTSLSIDTTGERIFTRLDWILLAASIVLFGLFAYLMYLNYRDWKIDRPPWNIEETNRIDPKPKTLADDEKELNEIIERLTLTSEAKTSPTSSTKEDPRPPPYRCNDQDACSLEAALSGLSDIVHNVMRNDSPSMDGTMPSHATSDVFDTINEEDRPRDWMKHVRISVLDSSTASLASRDSLKHAMVNGSSSTIYSGGSDQS